MATSPLNAVPVFFCQTPVPPHESHGPSKMTPIFIISFIPAPRLQSGACSQNFPAVAAAAMGPVVGKKGHVPYGCRPFVFFCLDPVAPHGSQGLGQLTPFFNFAPLFQPLPCQLSPLSSNNLRPRTPAPCIRQGRTWARPL